MYALMINCHIPGKLKPVSIMKVTSKYGTLKYLREKQ